MASVSLPYTCRAVYSGAQGTMRIAEDALYWQQDSASQSQALVAWGDVLKHMIAPPNSQKALVRIDLRVGGSIKFEVLPQGAKSARDVSVDCKELILQAKRAATMGSPAGSAASGGGGAAAQEGKGGKGQAEGGTRWKSDELQKRSDLVKARKEVAERAAEQVRQRMRELEKETRKSLLEQHPDLREQYTQMVGEGLISEEDFWDARRRLLLEEQAKREARRNKGTPSNILAEIESRAGECANNHVVKLKPRDIAYLFDLYPGLRELHRKKVPEEITEAQFWEQTLRSIRFHRQRMQAAADEYVQAQLIPTLNARDNREDLRRVDPVFDLTSGGEDAGRRHALHVDGRLPDADNETSREGSVTVNKLNRGSSLLLRTRHVGSLSEYTDMPDLRVDSSASGFQKLQLRNRDLYSTSTVTALEREALPDAPLGPLDESQLDLTAYTPDLPSVFPQPKVASWVLTQLSERASATSLASGGLDSRDVEESMPRAYLEFSRVSEFLRHFHAFHLRRLAGDTTAEVAKKLERLVEKMDQKSKELTSLRTSLLTKTKGQSALAYMLIPFQSQLSHAIEIYDAYARAPPPPPRAPVRAPTPPPPDTPAGSGRNTPVGLESGSGSQNEGELEIVPTDQGGVKRGREEGGGGEAGRITKTARV